MRETIQAAKVGTLVVVALVVGFLLYRAVDESSSRGQGYRVYAVFDDAQGLIAKSRVTIAGIVVGRIDRIKLENGRARVELVMDGDVPLYTNANIQRKSASLLGEFMLVIDPGSPNEPRIPNGGQIINASTAPGMSELMAQLGPTAAHIRAVAAQLERAFGTDEAGQQMQAALRSLSEALVTVNQMVQTNQEVINHTLANIEGITSDARPKLQDILTNVRVVTEDVRQLMENNRGDLDRGVGEVDDTIASIHRASEQLEMVLADVGEVTERTAAGEGTIGRLTSDDHLINEVESAVDGVSDFLGGITRLRTIVELRSEYQILQNGFKNTVGIRLMPREGRYFLVQLVDDPRGLQSFSTTQVRRSPPSALEPSYYEESRIETKRQMLFSLQLAQRVYFATFRFGIMESAGGLGMDLNFFDDKLEINADIFQFGYSRFPRLRARASFEVIPTLYLLAGVDDVMNERSFDFFLGAQLRFDDLDLLSILPFAGGAVAR